MGALIPDTSVVNCVFRSIIYPSDSVRNQEHKNAVFTVSESGIKEPVSYYVSVNKFHARALKELFSLVKRLASVLLAFKIFIGNAVWEQGIVFISERYGMA